MLFWGKFGQFAKCSIARLLSILCLEHFGPESPKFFPAACSSALILTFWTKCRVFQVHEACVNPHTNQRGVGFGLDLKSSEAHRCCPLLLTCFSLFLIRTAGRHRAKSLFCRVLLSRVFRGPSVDLFPSLCCNCPSCCESAHRLLVLDSSVVRG